MPGLTLELNNEQQFERALSTLERILFRIDSRLDTTGLALNAFERQLETIGRQRAYLTNISRLTELVGRLDTELRGTTPRLTQFFRELEAGFRSGNLDDALGDAGRRIARSFVEGLEGELGISSPSRVMRRIADDISTGFEQGIDSENFGDEGRRAADEFTDAFHNQARASIPGILNTIRNGLRGAGAGLIASGQGLSDRGVSLIQGGVQQVAFGGLAAFAQGQLINTAAEFDQTLNTIQVFGRLTEDEITRVQNAILDFSAATVFAPRESADAFLGLLKAGLDTAEALEALPEVGNLAAAAQLDLANATNLAIRAASAFRIPFSDLNRVIDTFVGGADISTAEVEDLAQALGFVGSSAAALEIPIEDVTAAIAALNDQGIVGERAGTGLRAALDALAAPTDQARNVLRRLGITVADQEGNFVGMSNLLNQFRESVQRLRDEGAGEAEIVELLSGLGDRNAASALLSLINTTEDGVLIFDDYRQSLETANDAQTVAESLMQTFRGSFESLRGSVEALLIRALLPLLNDGFKPIIDFLVVVINQIGELPQPVLTAAAAIVTLTTALITINGAWKIFSGLNLLLAGQSLITFGGIVSGLSSVLTITFIPTILAVGAALGIIAVGGAAAVRILQRVANIIQTDRNAGIAFNVFVGSIRQLFDVVLGTGREVLRILDEFVRTLFFFGDALGFAADVDANSVTRFFNNLARQITFVAGAINDLRRRLSEVSGVDLATGLIFGLQDAAEGLRNFQLPQVALPNIDLSGIADRLQSAVNGLDLSALDFSGVQSSIVTGLQDLSFEDVQTVFEQHFDAIIGLIATAASIVFGGPIGATIGIAKLVASAIENDFLGIRTFIEQSGIATAAEDAFNSLLDTIQGVIDSVFGGEGGLTLSPEVQGFLDDVQAGIDRLIEIGQGIIDTNIAPGLQDLGAGLQGFVQAVSGAETEGLDDLVLNIARVVGVVIGSVIVPLIEVGGLLVGGVLSGIGRALPQIGEAISSLISALSDIGEGDIGGAAINILQAIANVFDALIQFPVGIADQVINFLERLTGVDLAGVQEGFSALGQGLQAAGQALQIVIDRIKRAIEDFTTDVRLRIVTFIADLRQSILDASQGTLDIAPTIGIEEASIRREVERRQLADEIERVINEQLASGEPINISAPISFEGAASSIDTDLATLLADPAVLDEVSVTARDRILDAFRNAVESGDAETINVLQSAALDVGFSQEQLDLIRQAGNRVATDVVAGYQEGLETESDNARSATEDFAQDGIQTPFEDAMETGSPSQWMFRFGQDVVQGLLDGLNSMLLPLQNQTNVIVELFRTMSDSINLEVNRVVNATNIAASRVASGVNIIRGQILILIASFNELRLAADSAFDSVGNVPGLPRGTGLQPTARARGGDVQAGRFYEVAEPSVGAELLQIGGRTYLIPGQSGMVVPPQTLPTGSSGGASFGDVFVTYDIDVVAAPGMDAQEVADLAVDRIRREERNNPVQRRLATKGVT